LVTRITHEKAKSGHSDFLSFPREMDDSPLSLETYGWLRPTPPYFQSPIIHEWTWKLYEDITKNREKVEDLQELKNTVQELSSCLGQLQNEVASCKDCISRIADRPTIKNTELYDIGEGFDVVRPIPIVLEETEDETIANFPEVEVYAVGSGEAEAIGNLKKSIAELYLELDQTSEQQLGKVPQGWKRVLDKVIRQHGNTERIQDEDSRELS